MLNNKLKEMAAGLAEQGHTVGGVVVPDRVFASKLLASEPWRVTESSPQMMAWRMEPKVQQSLAGFAGNYKQSPSCKSEGDIDLYKFVCTN